MGIKRIIVIQSVEDGITEFRQFRIKINPILKAYDFEFCYAIELKNEEKNLSTGQMMLSVETRIFSSSDLFDRLTKQIESFNPDALIIHSGFVFMRFTIEMVSVLKSIKAIYPSIRYGIQDYEYFKPEFAYLFDGSDELNKIIQNIF
jgi:hypothetical protein